MPDEVVHESDTEGARKDIVEAISVSDEVAEDEDVQGHSLEESEGEQNVVGHANVGCC